MTAESCRVVWDTISASADTFVYMLFYTFDLDDVSEGLCAAKRRGVRGRLIGAQRTGLVGPTGPVKPQLTQLQTRGVEVRLAYGRDLSTTYAAEGRESASRRTQGKQGIQHAKVMGSETQAVIGSCNFTTSSQGNNEIGVLVKWTRAGHARFKAYLDELWTRSHELRDVQIPL